ncbi:MAG TPA: DUF1080 domain-containing protein [Planctomycetota bacterium]|nr:DUF1080 domain-containing protein [Planctomycetota bacterium]
MRSTAQASLWSSTPSLLALVTSLALSFGTRAAGEEPSAPETAPTADAPAKEPEGKWVQLFNGKNLDGWKVKIRNHELGENWKNTFRVEDGVLKVSYDQYDRFDETFGHIFYDGTFTSYLLRIEYRFTGEQCPGGPGWAFRNSGVMLHGQDPETMTKDQDFPVSVEVQFLGGSGRGTRTTANLCTPGTHVVMDGKLVTRHCTNSRSKTYHGDQWVTVLIEVRGNRIRHIIDDETVLEYTDPHLDETDANARRLLEAGHERMIRGGTISLQSESHPIEFRKVEILELDDDKKDADDASKVVDLLAGKSLEKHWETKGNWKIDDEGVVTLTPRPGESGWARFDAYLWSKEEYDDFEIEFDYKLERRGNSGFYFNVGDKANPVEKGIEVQIYDSHGKAEGARLTDHDSGGIIPAIPPTKSTAKAAGEWNHFRIRVEGKKLTVELNGTTVNEVDLADPRLGGRPDKGWIGFQDHALPLALRNVTIRRL